MTVLIELDLQTLLFSLGCTLIGGVGLFMWCIHKGWLSVE